MAEGPVMDGLMLMGMGMTTVFAFLILMVLAMIAQAALWTLNLPVPKGGLPAKLDPKVIDLN